MTGAGAAGTDGPAGTATGPGAGERRGHPVRWAAAVVAVLALGLVAVLGTRPSALTRSVDSPLLGTPAPSVRAPTVDGGEFSLDATRGSWVLVNFFATWCVPCRQEHDDLIRFSQRHRQLGDAQVVGVIYEDDPRAVRKFLAENGGDWPMLLDTDGRIALDFGVAGIPESFLVSPDGTITAKIVGGVRTEALERLFGEAQVLSRGAGR